VVLQGKAGAVTARTRKRRNDGTASISNDSEISASVSASICVSVSLSSSLNMITYVEKEDLFESLGFLFNDFIEFLTWFCP